MNDDLKIVEDVVFASRPRILGTLLSRNNRKSMFFLRDLTGHLQVLNRLRESFFSSVYGFRTECLLLGDINHSRRRDKKRITSELIYVCSQGRVPSVHVSGLLLISGHDAGSIYSFVSL